MAVPKYYELMKPLLVAVKDGGMPAAVQPKKLRNQAFFGCFRAKERTGSGYKK